MFHHDVEDVADAERLLWRFGMPFGLGTIMLIAGVLGMIHPSDRGLLPALTILCGLMWLGMALAWGRRHLNG